ncbi:MAG: V-type ATP synthase subunit A [Acholeplasmatales bacterium]|jgi:V/A-type H+-transporting ATPase subunit A|nr:V-type ATP synthase subunit A [Acholeplasmatales bacterium]
MSDKEIIGRIIKVSGPLVVASGLSSAQVYDVVRVGEKRLLGEVIELRGENASIQVYEETAGIGVEDPVFLTSEPLSVWLAPGLIGNIFDGIERPLKEIYEQEGITIPLGIDIDRLDTKKGFDFKPLVKVGDTIKGGDILGEVSETPSLLHKIMLSPKYKSGKVTKVLEGTKNILETIVVYTNIDEEEVLVPMLQLWPIRRPRPVLKKLAPKIPMKTGQRTIDALFPIALGGIAAIPGPFGSGKTVVQHQLAKWSDCDVIVYVGCGERGNEMTDVLMEFPELIDPYTKQPLMNRTVLIANTSNMPVAAREASIYTGITIAEYYRDMGYKVAIMADSTSRWAEALREMSSRLEEMPGEEGYPAYLGSRLSEFYERAGLVETLSHKIGAITAIGAISPAGGDTSEPVSQATLRIVKVFWSLSASLAYKRHFPAIDWLKSYSLYDSTITKYYDDNNFPRWSSFIKRAQRVLEEEEQLLEIVRLVGMDTLSFSDRLKLLEAQMIREDFLLQNAFDKVDSFSSSKKEYVLLNLIYSFIDMANKKLNQISKFKEIEEIPVREIIGRFKYVEEEKLDKEYNSIIESIISLEKGA